MKIRPAILASACGTIAVFENVGKVDEPTELARYCFRVVTSRTTLFLLAGGAGLHDLAERFTPSGGAQEARNQQGGLSASDALACSVLLRLRTVSDANKTQVTCCMRGAAIIALSIAESRLLAL